MTVGINSLIEVALNQTVMAQQNLNVYQYRIVNFAIGVNAVQIAEAWWNHVKTTMRAVASSTYGAAFISVRLRELNNVAGDYAEFDIPTGERTGTRAAFSGDTMPPFAAGGVRLVVATRTTRPGQKRYAYVGETDNVAGVLQSAYTTLLQNLLNVITVPLSLGAPAALVSLQPIITRKASDGTVIADQNVTGYIINQNVTTQNSRKFGRGS